MLKIDNELKQLIPPLSSEEFEQLEKNILVEGIREPIIVWEDIIVDGHNRYEIAQKHDLKFNSVYKRFDNRDEVIDWMINNQLGRRNLTKETQSYLRGTQYNREKKKIGAPENNKNAEKQIAQNEPIVSTAKKLADQHNVSRETIKRDEAYAKAVDTIVENTTPEVKQMILSRKIEINKEETQKLAKKEPEKQREIIEKAIEKQPPVKEVIQEIKKENFKADIQKQKKEIEEGIAVLPEGVFEVLSIDPPWNYGTSYDGEGRRVANPYPEMTQEELKQIKLPSADNSVLFLWTTQKFIWEAKELLDHWGFTYRSTIVWDKEKMGVGDLFRMQCEFCLVGIKGEPVFDNDHKNRDIIREPRREHSRKPDAFFEMVDKLCVGRKLEYFSREARKGWEVFGNDTSKF